MSPYRGNLWIPPGMRAPKEDLCVGLSPCCFPFQHQSWPAQTFLHPFDKDDFRHPALGPHTWLETSQDFISAASLCSGVAAWRLHQNPTHPAKPDHPGQGHQNHGNLSKHNLTREIQGIWCLLRKQRILLLLFALTGGSRSFLWLLASMLFICAEDGCAQTWDCYFLSFQTYYPSLSGTARKRLTAFVPLPSHRYHQISGYLKIWAIISILGLEILAWLY